MVKYNIFFRISMVEYGLQHEIVLQDEVQRLRLWPLCIVCTSCLLIFQLICFYSPLLCDGVCKRWMSIVHWMWCLAAAEKEESRKVVYKLSFRTWKLLHRVRRLRIRYSPGNELYMWSLKFGFWTVDFRVYTMSFSRGTICVNRIAVELCIYKCRAGRLSFWLCWLVLLSATSDRHAIGQKWLKTARLLAEAMNSSSVYKQNSVHSP